MNDQKPGLPENWKELTADQKRAWRLDSYFSDANISFVSSQAKESYNIRAKRFKDVYNLREPDRVPVSLPLGNLHLTLNGANMRTAMYDYNNALEACLKFNARYSEELEFFASPAATSGKVLDLLDYRLYSWPGHGLPAEAPGFQFIESEYMKAEEYDDLIRDPSDFWFRTYLPRVFGAFEPFKLVQSATDITEIVNLNQLAPLARPEMQSTLQKLLEAGREYQKIEETIGPYSRSGPSMGFPREPRDLFAKAPFDSLGDTLRGTTNIMKDMYRRPDKVIQACDKLADLAINSILRHPNEVKSLTVYFPLHKGADGWMSQKQFETFYWPSLKKVMDALIAEGLIPSLFAEGSFNTRLEYFTGFPKGSVIILFDQSDIFRAKQILGTNCCIKGNIPASFIVTAYPSDVKEYCRKLIEGCGKDGGYILAAGCIPENPKLENLQAIMQAAREYGLYKK
jgi:hypothetical protein